MVVVLLDFSPLKLNEYSSSMSSSVSSTHTTDVESPLPSPPSSPPLSRTSTSYPPSAPSERELPPLPRPDRGKDAYLFLLGAFAGAHPCLFPFRLFLLTPPLSLQLRRSSGASLRPTVSSSTTTSVLDWATTESTATAPFFRSLEPSHQARSVRLRVASV